MLLPRDGRNVCLVTASTFGRRAASGLSAEGLRVCYILVSARALSGRARPLRRCQRASQMKSDFSERLIFTPLQAGCCELQLQLLVRRGAVRMI